MDSDKREFFVLFCLFVCLFGLWIRISFSWFFLTMLSSTARESEVPAQVGAEQTHLQCI